MQTLAGRMTVTKMVVLRDLRLPGFNNKISIQEQKTLVFDTLCQHDTVLGSDFLKKVGKTINYDKSVVEWYDSKLPF